MNDYQLQTLAELGRDLCKLAELAEEQERLLREKQKVIDDLIDTNILLRAVVTLTNPAELEEMIESGEHFYGPQVKRPW